jgi:hypothetical protein
MARATFLKSALNDRRSAGSTTATPSPDDLLERHRHNLPEWLVAPLKAQLGDGSGRWSKACSSRRRSTCASTR